ncbi:uncharacterized protein J3R85_013356 [Psidium guajava]|nr:uncharacterized protein J3R85_013356 [Psidium guajava]
MYRPLKPRGVFFWRSARLERKTPARSRVFFVLRRLKRADQPPKGAAYGRHHMPVEELEGSIGRGPQPPRGLPEGQPVRLEPRRIRDREQHRQREPRHEGVGELGAGLRLAPGPGPLAGVRADRALARELEQVVQRGVLMRFRWCPVLRWAALAVDWGRRRIRRHRFAAAATATERAESWTRNPIRT